MTSTNDLLDRLEAEFRQTETKIREFQAEKVREFEGRQERRTQFGTVCEKLSSVWKPRLEALAEKFKDRVQVAPTITGARRSATFNFESPLAQFRLTFSATTDEDVRNLVIDYTLDVLPILMKFEKHQQFEQPLDRVDSDAVGQWIDDRIIDAVRVYLQIHQNANYLKGHLVQDPIAGIEFPDYAAAATLDWNGKKYYFIGEPTRAEFVKKNKIG